MRCAQGVTPIDDAGAGPLSTPAHQTPPAWRVVDAQEGMGGLRGAAQSEVRSPSLAGGRAPRRPAARGHKHQPDPQDKQRSYETSDTSTGGDHQEFETPNTTARRRGHENGRIHRRTCHRFQPRQRIGEQRSHRYHLESVGLAIPNQVRTSSPSRAARPHQAEQDEFSRAVASPAPRGAWRASVTPQRAED